MNPHRASGSKTDLLLACQYWARCDVEVPVDESGQPAKDGNATHALGEAFIAGEELDVDVACRRHGGDEERVNKLWQSAHAVYRSLRSLHQGLIAAEVALVYSAVDGDVWRLERSSHRDYGVLSATGLPATADIVIAPSPGTPVTVIDLKTGDPDNLPAPERSGQLRTLGLMAARYYGSATAVVGFAVAFDDGRPAEMQWATLDNLDLEMHEIRLRGAIEAIPDAEPNPGEWCKWCVARAGCPATIASMATVAEMPREDIEAIAAAAIQTPEQAALAHRRLKVIKDAVKAVDARIREVVEQHGEVPTSNGKVLRIITTKRETFSKARLPKDQAESVLRILRDAGALQESESSYVGEGKARAS